MKNIENNLPCIQDQNQEIIDDFNSYNNYNTSQCGIQRSEVRSSWGLRIFCLSHACDKTKKQNIFLWLQFSLTMSSHCGSTLSMVTRHFIGLLQIIIAIDYIISLSNPVYINCQEAANFEFFFFLSLNIQKVLSFSQIAIAFFTFSYKTRFLGNFVKLTFESICLNSKHVLFGCRKQPLVCLLAIFRKSPPIWRTNGNKWSSDAYNMRQIK